MGSAAAAAVVAAIVAAAGWLPNWWRPCCSVGERGTWAGVGDGVPLADGDEKKRRKAHRRGDGRRYP